MIASLGESYYRFVAGGENFLSVNALGSLRLRENFDVRLATGALPADNGRLMERLLDARNLATLGVLALAALNLVFSSARGEDEKLTFEKQIAPIFQARC